MSDWIGVPAPYFATCDWGDCDEPTTAQRVDNGRWLCVCFKHALEPGAIIRIPADNQIDPWWDEKEKV